jgi:hypothetical protein
MNDSLYIVVELGAGVAAIITFLITFLALFRKWVLARIYRDLEPHLAKRDALAARYARRAREAAGLAAEAASEARRAALRARQAHEAPVEQEPGSWNADDALKGSGETGP